MKTSPVLNVNTGFLPKSRRGQPKESVHRNLVCLAALFLFFSTPLVGAQSCNPNGGGNINGGSPTCNVQYQTTNWGLDKCYFPEYTNENLPRVHWYHHQTTQVVYNYDEDDSGTNADGNGGDYGGGQGWSETCTYGPFKYDLN